MKIEFDGTPEDLLKKYLEWTKKEEKLKKALRSPIEVIYCPPSYDDGFREGFCEGYEKGRLK